jgi:tetratricopeptide (TPR) repeat protein
MQMITRSGKSVLAGLVLAATALSVPAFAAGPEPSGTKPCDKGMVWDGKTSKCVPAAQGAIPDDGLADYAYLLAQEGRYEEALATLDLMRDPNTAEALNYRGYATRKLGRVDEGIAYYQRAVALDPDYTLVREYLGEAYLIKGRPDLAKVQLAEIEKRCGTTCEPYGDLAEAIAAGPQG